MAYQNQHSHIFLVDLTSLGEMKYNRGVRKLPGILKECLDLAVVSAQTLIQCVGIIMTSQVGEVVEWNLSEWPEIISDGGLQPVAAEPRWKLHIKGSPAGHQQDRGRAG